MPKRLLRLLLVTLAFAPLPLLAQDLEAGYFLGGNPYAFRLNPAFQSERNIITVGLGLDGVSLVSNLGVSSLLYPDATGEKLYLFMNDHVTVDQVLSKLQRQNRLSVDAQVNLAAAAWWAGRNFYSIDVNLRNLDGFMLPYDLFRFLKGEKAEGAVYECARTGVQSISYVDAAFGWSWVWNDRLSVGARAHFLVGAMEQQLMLSKMRVMVNKGSWSVESRGDLVMSSPALEAQKEGDVLNPTKMSWNWSQFSPAGWGGAVDLGVRWDPIPDLTLSAALLDLGTIRWNRELAYATPESSYSWAPSAETEEHPANDYKNELMELIDFAFNFLAFREVEGAGPAFQMLPCRVNVGAEYRMPFYERLSVGALYQGRYGGSFTHNLGRISLNCTPLDWLSASTSATLTRIGESFGFALCLHPVGVNFVLGCDYVPLRTVSIAPLLKDLEPCEKPYAVVPRDQLKLNLYLGLNVAFGARRLDYCKRFH